MRKAITKAAGLLGCTVEAYQPEATESGLCFAWAPVICWQCLSLWAALAATWGGCVAMAAGWVK